MPLAKIPPRGYSNEPWLPWENHVVAFYSDDLSRAGPLLPFRTQMAIVARRQHLGIRPHRELRDEVNLAERAIDHIVWAKFLATTNLREI